VILPANCRDGDAGRQFGDEPKPQTKKPDYEADSAVSIAALWLLILA
jgi:hypothetical protein